MHLTTLPEETFAPYRGVANACVAVLRKTQPAPGPYEFGLAESISVGYDATGRPSGESDLSFLSSQAPGNRLSRRTVADSGTLTSGGGGPASPATCRLGDVADIFTGRNPARDSYVERGGAFLLKVGSLAGSFVSWKVRRRSLVPLDFFNSYPSKHLRPGDICLTSSAHRPSYIGLKVDLLSRIPLPGAIASNEVMVIRLRRDAPLSPVSLLYYLRSSAGRRSVQALVKGSTAHVYPRDVAELRIPLPDGRYDESTLVEMHSAAEDAFYRYIELEAEARALAGAKPPNDDEAN